MPSKFLVFICNRPSFVATALNYKYWCFLCYGLNYRWSVAVKTHVDGLKAEMPAPAFKLGNFVLKVVPVVGGFPARTNQGKDFCPVLREP